SGTPAPSRRALEEEIRTLLEAAFLQDAKISIHVRDLSSDTTVFEVGGATTLNPASNVKLVTTAAALSILGPAHRYETAVYAPAPVDGTITGDLYLVGGGDPSLLTGDLYELASRLRAIGVKRITGGVVVDSGLFGADLSPPGYEQKQEFAAYRAPIGATSVNFNTIELRVLPGERNAPVRASVRPPVPSVVLENKGATNEGSKRRIRIQHLEGPHDGLGLRIEGTMGDKARSALYRYPVAAPARYTGEVFALTLSQVGIELGETNLRLGDTPETLEPLAIHRSDPLGMLIRAVNKLSSNFMAELIMHGLDREDPVAPQGGLDRVREWASEIPILDGDAWIGNGSGLYDNNRLSAAQLTRLLQYVHDDFRIYGDFLASLAIMGKDGTTRRRLSDPPHAGWIRAKTGTLDHVSALTG
ncbi:MAG: D-alanyl-D-alanine carboxypeptidase/D-alanyl-D-alanine endopeptidase, partial [Nannocystaceae bacterium]